jgi:hypothetical protein
MKSKKTSKLESLGTKVSKSKREDSDGDSSDERNEAIIEDVFEKYSNQGLMTKNQFSLVVEKLSNHVKELKGVEMETAEAAFNLFSTKDQVMTLGEFKEWWSSTEKFSYFTGKKSKNVSKAYELYKRYSSVKTLNTSTENFKARRMTLKEFLKLLEDLKIEAEDDGFYQIDSDGDGTLSFKEFCAWLNWF